MLPRPMNWLKKHRCKNTCVLGFAGLDAGWWGRIEMQQGAGDSWSVTRRLLPGVYPFKYVMDGVWSYDIDQHTVDDGGNINNVIEVPPTGLSRDQAAARNRVLKSGGKLTDEEFVRVREALGIVTSKL